MAVQRFARRIIISGDTEIHLLDWTDTVTVWLASDPQEIDFKKRLELDAHGNVRLTGHVTIQAGAR